MVQAPATTRPHGDDAISGTGRARRDEDGTDAWDGSADGGTPCLDLDGFSGPLDLLLALARAQRIDLHRIALPDLLGQLAPALRQAAPLVERGGWLVMAAWVVLLRSRLLLHDGPTAVAEAPARTDRHARRLRAQLLGLQQVQAVAAWLDRRPQLGRDVFGRGAQGTDTYAGDPRGAVDVAGFLWATLDLLDGGGSRTSAAAAYAPQRPALHSIADARARILRLLGTSPQPMPLARLLPEPDSREGTVPAHAGAQPTPRDALLRRSGWASALAASLELAKQGQVTLTQGEDFAPILVRAGPEPGTASL
jgi:segregation and condensation protein A